MTTYIVYRNPKGFEYVSCYGYKLKRGFYLFDKGHGKEYAIPRDKVKRIEIAE